MAYFGLVTKLCNVHKDENSDRLYLAECFGEGVIVGSDMREGGLVLYLPTDGKIERWFGNAFNLFRKNEDGTPQGGYIEDNGHIRAIKLRNNQSSGVVIALDKIYEKFGEQNWHDGDKVNTINDKVFCSKYIPKRRHVPTTAKKTSYKGRKAEGIVYPEFDMHKDTEQLAYNLDKFRPGDKLNMSLKMHGCWIADTKVRMANNKLKRITAIRPGDYVLGYNFETHKIEPTKVIHVFHNAPSKKWNRIKLSRNNIKGDKRGTQTSTWNHKYWVEEKQEWIMAQDLHVGDTISTLYPSPVLTDLQKQIAIGSFLGDGCLLQFNNTTAEIQESKKVEHKEYLEYLSKVTQNWFYVNQESKTSEYNSLMVSGRTTRAADLYNYMCDCTTWNNQPNTPRLKEGIVKKITPLSIALWYIGDGSLSHNDTQQDRALLAICRYDTPHDQDIIMQCFQKFNITPTFYNDAQGYGRLRFNLQEANRLFELIAPYIPEIMQYKLPEQYQNRFCSLEDKEKYNPNGWVLSPQTVLENESINEQFDEWDLETELHNYVVGLSVVHNTSQRSMKTYAELPNGFWRRLFHMKKKKKEVYVCGTRRCVVTENSEGYYGNDAFRMPHHKKIEPFVENGMEIFYEVVGYYGDNETDTIMPIADNSKINDKAFMKQFGKKTVFSYGCKPSESEMYVYRITVNNGEKEYTPAEIVAWCEKAGVHHVPYIEDFEFTTVEDLQERVNKYFEDLVDPIGRTHVKEGVVIRKLNGLGWQAYKSKTFEFRVLSGLAAENANVEMLSEDMLQEI